MELQADCYAGVWAANDRNLLEPGDAESGMKAAQAIGERGRGELAERFASALERVERDHARLGGRGQPGLDRAIDPPDRVHDLLKRAARAGRHHQPVEPIARLELEPHPDDWLAVVCDVGETLRLEQAEQLGRIPMAKARRRGRQQVAQDA